MPSSTNTAANVLRTGFEKATSTSLPTVDFLMAFEYLTKDPRFVSAEGRCQKMQRASMEFYGDNAVGYVQIKREESICTVLAESLQSTKFPSHHTEFLLSLMRRILL